MSRPWPNRLQKKFKVSGASGSGFSGTPVLQQIVVKYIDRYIYIYIYEKASIGIYIPIYI